MLDAAKLLWFLVAAHILCDFQLQPAELSRAKNRQTLNNVVPWWVAMGAHGLIHGGAVLLITGSLALSAVELFAHMTIDFVKNEGKIAFRTDQILHVLLKVAYAGILFACS